MTVDGGDDRRRFAGDVHQDGGRRAAVRRAEVDAGEQDERTFRADLGRDAEQDGHGTDRADAGQYADQGAEGDAGEGEQEQGRVGEGTETCPQVSEDVCHRILLTRDMGGQTVPKRPTGSGMNSQ